MRSINDATSLLKQQVLDHFEFSVSVVFNGDKLSAAQKIELTKDLDLKVDYITMPKVNPSEARNKAIRETQADYLYFIDDDTTLPQNFLEKVCRICTEHPELDIFGGPDTPPLEATYFQNSLGLALCSPLTTLKTRKRHFPKKAPELDKGNEKNLILCNLCVKKAVFDKYQVYFPEDYLRNEENFFLNQLKDKALIGYFQNHYIYHDRRSQLKSVFTAASKSSVYRIKMLRDNFHLADLPFLAPFFFVCYLLILIFQINWPLLIYPFYIYLGLNLVTSLRVCLIKASLRFLPAVMFYQFFIVASYGFGTILALKNGFSKR